MVYKKLIRLIAVFLSVLLFYAAIGKLDKYALFGLQMNRPAFAIPVINAQPWLVPVTELVIAGLLVLPAYRVKALFASLFLFTVYTVYLAWMLDNRYAEPCACGEPWQSFSLQVNIILNFVCVWVAGVGVVLCGRVIEPVSGAGKKNKKLSVVKVGRSQSAESTKDACC
jgi:uncharacterized membrane protein YphA (DoxX/SURF4 family)